MIVRFLLPELKSQSSPSSLYVAHTRRVGFATRFGNEPRYQQRIITNRGRKRGPTLKNTVGYYLFVGARHYIHRNRGGGVKLRPGITRQSFNHGFQTIRLACSAARGSARLPHRTFLLACAQVTRVYPCLLLPPPGPESPPPLPHHHNQLARRPLL